MKKDRKIKCGKFESSNNLGFLIVFGVILGSIITGAIILLRPPSQNVINQYNEEVACLNQTAVNYCLTQNATLYRLDYTNDMYGFTFGGGFDFQCTPDSSYDSHTPLSYSNELNFIFSEKDKVDCGVIK